MRKILISGIAALVSMQAATFNFSDVLASGYLQGGGYSYGYLPSNANLWMVDGSDFTVVLMSQLLPFRCTMSGAGCDPSFEMRDSNTALIWDKATRVVNIPGEGPVTVMQQYTVAVSLDLIFTTSDRYTPSLTCWGSAGCAYGASGPVTYVLTGTQTWTNPNGDVVNVTILPTLVTGTFTDMPGEACGGNCLRTNSSLDLTFQGAATPEPVTGPVALLALAGMVVSYRLRRMVDQ